MENVLIDTPRNLTYVLLISVHVNPQKIIIQSAHISKLLLVLLYYKSYLYNTEFQIGKFTNKYI